MSDPYRILGLSRGATEAEIKAAHRLLAKRHHPDSDGGDTDRFLDVQEAYKLLVDPLRRREWDARHAAGPVRASERGNVRPRAPNGRWTRAEQSAGPPNDAQPAAAAGRDPASRRYTWSASEVPWWEEGMSRDNRRQPGRRRPRETTPPPPDEAGAAAPGTGASHDFDVYNRSSGAAWSMAARAYFRRGEADLPRRGSFRQQGSQPLTAARARVAADEEVRRGRSASTAPSARVAQPGRAAAPQPAAGVVRDAGTISEVRAAARQELLAQRWPSLGQRMLYALLAWLPVALLIGYGGAWVSGCDRAAISCPPELALLQPVAIALALGVLVALPRLAYALAVATAGVMLAGILLVIGIWLLGLRPPLPPSVLALSSALLLVVHLAVATWVLSRGARRPWAAGHLGRSSGR